MQNRLPAAAAILSSAVLAVILSLGPVAGAQSSDIVISELFYNPPGQDESNEFVELTNIGSTAVDLNGWTFTSGIDHVFADGTNLAAGASIVLAADAPGFAAAFGSNPDATYGGNLANGGETITLSAPVAGGLLDIDAVAWDDVPPWPVAADGSGDSLQILNPQADNASPLNWGAGPPSPRGASQLDLAVLFSVQRGWYDNTQIVTLTATKPGATIRYNTNGSGSTTQTYSGPITISDNNDLRVLQASASLGGETSPVATHTYVFRPDNGVPVVAVWNNPVPADPDEVESTITFEFIAPPSTGLAPVFGYAGMKASEGGVDAGDSDKVFFRGTYGFGTLNGDLFGDNHYGIEPTREHDQLFLRDEHLDGTHLRQIMAHDSLLDLGQLSPHGRFVMYQRDGQNLGVRHLQERPEGGFMESYTGIKKDQWEAWSRNDNGLGAGSMGAPFNSWSQVTPIINPESLIDSLLVQWQANVSDYRGPKNFRTAGPTSPALGDGGEYRFHYFNWDMDLGYANNLYRRGSPTVWGWAGFVSPDYIGHELDHLPEFRLLASDRITCAHYNGGPLTTTALMERSRARNAELVAAGGNDASSWLNSVESWANSRNNWLIDQYRSDTTGRTVYHNARPDTAPYKPPSNFNGPLFPPTMPLNVMVSGNTLTISGSAPGTVYYRLDGGDPRTESGGLHPDAILYTGPTTLLSGQHDIIARAYNSSQADVVDRWSPACNDASAYRVAATPGSVVINEIHYNPVESGVEGQPGYVDGDNFEFLELHNPGSSPVGVGGFSFIGIDHIIPAGTTIEPGGYLVLASRAQDFITRYGQAPDGDYSGRLNDGGEQLRLVGSTGTLIDEVTWDDTDPWPTEPDETGPSLSLIDPGLNNAAPSSWGASNGDHGSPWAANDVRLALTATASRNCLATDGRITVRIVNPNTASEMATVRIGHEAPQLVSVAPGTAETRTLSGAGDGTWPVVVTDDATAATALSTAITVACDQTASATWAQRCVAADGVIETTIANPNSFPLSATLTAGGIAKTVVVDPFDTADLFVSGRPDGQLAVQVDAAWTVNPPAAPDAPTGSSNLLAATAAVDCDPLPDEASVSWSCLAGNGRVDVALTNVTGSSQTYTIDVNGIVKTAVFGAGDNRTVSVSGRPDGPAVVTVSRGGAAVYQDTLTVDCDPDVEVAVTQTCLAGNGRINVALTNVLDSPVNYRVTVGPVGPRSKILQPQQAGLVSVTGRPDGPITVVVTRSNNPVTTEVLTVDCDPDVEAVASTRCLSGNGRIDVDLTNVTTAVALYEVEIAPLAPRSVMLAPQEPARISVTGRADADWPVVVRRDGVVVFTDTAVIDCDPDVELAVNGSCLNGRGRIDVAVTNMTGSTATYAATFNGAFPKSATVAPGDDAVLTVTGRPNGGWTTEVTRDGSVIATEAVTITC